ncbi:MAG: Smr/MutS family protein [Dysgonamonadaceae bacterium]|jgi:DNA mismatch repair protein MutS2|nr:Smr/MutS family protein [Dysgonamonadaceae bacterium]
MIYPENFEQKTGFDTVRRLISAHCLSPLGLEKAEEMRFSTDYPLIAAQLNQTHEFTQILAKEDNFPSDNYYDLREGLKKIRVEGAYLTEKELFDLRRSLETINSILHFFAHSASKTGETAAYPHLKALAADVAAFPHITKQIDAILDRFGQIRDNASPTLAEIRRRIAQTESSISRTLQKILKTAQTEGFIDADVSPTMRDGRLTIPVLPAFKRKISGIVHDESATGKTVFIEPQEVVEANNLIRELESEEKREIIRILTAFSDSIRPEIPDILNSYLFLAEIDFIRAKALFANEIQAIMPEIEDKPQIDFRHAIHPLLFLSHKKQGKNVVPLNINLNTKDKILVVSGPNAGGKSVLLKTVGLLQYMLQSGVLIPVGERSKTGIFNNIFIDIGDEQSIENDLSTYSSHLTNMKFMVKNGNSETLLLIDEFGGGTEPRIGGAIAEALLHRFNEKGCFGVITTHYHNLKTYAEDHEGVVNGAMLYDRNGMQPLFQLSVGKPGSSFAIEIARKIGLPEDVIAEAAEKVGQDYINLDKYLQDIVRDKRYWEAKRQEIRREEKSLEELAGQYRKNLENFESQKREWLNKARTDAENLLAEANSQIEKTIREIKEAQAEKSKTREIRKNLDDFKNSISTKAEGREGAEARRREGTKARRHEGAKALKQPQFAPSRFKIGDSVRLKGQQTAGTILDQKDDYYIVAFGAIKTNLKASQIEAAKPANSKAAKQTARTKKDSNLADLMDKKMLNFKPEIDLRGMRGDEALQAATYFIDDAIQCNAGRVRILHGTGTGALRQIIRDYLRTVDGVKHFQDEHVQFGGAGITVVELD